MKSSLKLAALAALLGAASMAQAESLTDGVYAELGYAFVNYTEDTAGVDMNPGVMRLIVGKNVHEYLAIEAMAGVGMSDGSQDFYNGALKVKGKVDHTFGAYLKPKFELTKDIEVFARLGYAQSKASASAHVGNYSISASDSGSSLSYGFGASVKFTPNVFGSIDYMSYYDKNSTKAEGVTASVGYKF